MISRIQALFNHFGTALGSFLGHLGVTFGVCRWLRDAFGSFWGHSELTLGPLVAYEDEFRMVKVSSWVDKSQFLKNTHFPLGF